MRSFKNHKLLTEFVENLFEFNILTRAKGSIGTWASGKFEKLPGWFKDGFSNAGIPLTNTSTFEIVDGAPEDNNPIIGNPTKDIVVYTNVYDTPNGNLQGTVAWTQDPSKSFKELKQGTAIAWGSNTDALESAQCVGVYLKVDDALADAKKLGVAAAKAKWNPQIKSVLSNGQDWDSGGVSKLVSKMDNMPDANWLEMLLLAKGMKNFIDKEGKNIGSTYHIIHGSIKPDYYNAEIKNQTTTPNSKDNTADMILANVSATDVIDAVGSQPIDYDKQKYYCHTTDKERKIKFYQISLKKAMDGAQLGKFTKSVKVIYGLDDSSSLLQSILKKEMVHYGYELTQLNEGWFTDKLKQGIAAVKSFASKWYEKIVGLFNKIKELGKSFLTGFNREIPSGRPNLYQINLMTKVLQESGKLQKGEFLTEGRKTKKSINEDLKNLNATEVKAVLKEVNTQIKHIEDSFSGNDYLVGLIHPKGQVKDSQYTEDRRGKRSWALNDIIKLFANASALDAFIKIVFKNSGDMSLLKDQMIDLEREIYFGKTQLPLFKVYGALKPDDTDTVERLGTAKEFITTERKKIEGAGFQWPVVGFSCTNQTKYYNVEGILLTGADETVNEPTFTQCRMGTNKADAFSFVIEGTAVKTWDQFKTKFSKDPASKNWT